MFANHKTVAWSSSLRLLRCHRRGFQRKVVTSPWAVRMLGASRKFLLGVGAIYGAGIVVTGGIYFYTSFKLQKIQPVPTSWTFKQGLLTMAGAHNQEEGNHESVCKYYEQLVNELLSTDSETKMTNLNNQTAEWLAGYADVVIRLGLSRALVGQDQAAMEALESGLSIPYGQQSLKTKAATQLGRFELGKSNYTKSTEYFKQALLGPEVLSKSLENVQFTPPVHDASAAAAMELAKIYSKTGEFEAALKLMLRLHRALHNFQPRDLKCREAQVASYIGELLWAMRNKRDAIAWSESSYYMATNKSRESAECGLCAAMSAKNTATMYKKLGNTGEYVRFKNLSESQFVGP